MTCGRGESAGAPGGLRFFHGTSSAHLQAALAYGGLNSPYVTDDVDRAWYYAEEAAEEDGSEPVVVELRGLDHSGLRYDRAAMDEPVLADEDERDQAWDRAAAEHPEWVTGQTISVPAHAWQVSWLGVGSARYAGAVTDFSILGAGHLATRPRPRMLKSGHGRLPDNS